MGIFDQAARYAAREEPTAVLARRLPSEPARAFREWLDTRTLPLPGGPDRAADLVAALEPESDPSLLVLEFQNRHDADKLDTSLEVAGVLRARVRYGPNREGRYRVLTALVYLKGRCPDAVLDMTVAGGFGTRHAPLVWNVCDDGASAALDAVTSGTAPWGLLFWVPLMAGADSDALVHRWREVTLARVESRRTRGDMAGVALVFAELIDRRPLWARNLEGFDVTESVVVNEWMAAGRVSERRENLLIVLDGRFPGAVPDEVRRLIETQESMPMLHDWLRAASRANSFADFLAVLKR
jgi:hypothetical protein